MLREAPKNLKYAVAIAVVLSWVPLVLIARGRSIRSDHTRLQPLQDMGRQPKVGPQSVNPVFADRRGMRKPVAGTVARGKLHEDEAFGRGTIDGQFVNDYPEAVRRKWTIEFLNRGRERYDIFCAVCHGKAGYGDGIVHQRAGELGQVEWIAPSSLHTDQVRGRELGYLFNVVTHGVVNQGRQRMPPYGPQIAVEDRWAIVAYIRALQESQNAGYDDLSEDEKRRLP